MINIWGNTSVFTSSSFFLFRIWQGKALICNLIVPLLLIFFHAFYEDIVNNKDAWLLLTCISASAALLSGMGISLMPILTAIYAFIIAIRTKRIKIVIVSISCCAPCIIAGLLSFVVV